MKLYRIISLVLHPAVLPTVGILIYFLLTPTILNQQQELFIIAIVFLVSYIIPIISIFLLKAFGFIKTMSLISIKERKVPVFLMIALFYLLGKAFTQNSITSDLGMLFYASSLGLIAVYILFFWNLKTSLHLLAVGNMLGFLLILNLQYGIEVLPAVMLLIVLSGILGTARIALKAHTPKEVYIGFFTGFFSQLSLLFWL